MNENEIKQAAKMARRAYLKTWRDKNKDKTKATNQKHWIKKAKMLGMITVDNNNNGVTLDNSGVEVGQHV